jgi:hypothetical protein
VASVTINGGTVFPEGTSVSVYPRSAWAVEGVTGAPSGSAAAGPASITNGTATFTGLADRAEYIAYASSPNRYKRFSTPPISAGATLDTRELTSNVSWNTPMVRPILSGTFIPADASVLVDLAISHQIAEAPGSHVSWSLFYAPQGTTPLTPKHQGDALPAGVTQVLLGSTAGFQASSAPRALLTGLTPGQTYAYEISLGLPGYASYLALTAPTYAAVSTTYSPYPDQALCLAVKDTSPALKLYRAQHTLGRVSETSLGSVALPAGSTLGRVALTPDGTKAIVANTQGGSVSIVTTGLVSGAAPALQGTYALTGTSPSPTDVVVTADGSAAWVAVAGAGNHRLIRVVLADGTMPTSYDLGMTTTAAPQRIVLSPDGAYAYVSTLGSANKAAVKVRLSDGVVTQGPTQAGAKALGISTDGNHLFVATTGLNPNKVLKVATVDMSTVTSVNMPNTTDNAESIGMFPDGRGFLVASSTATGSQIKQFETADLSNYTNWPNVTNLGAAQPAADVAVTLNGTIYVPSQAGNCVNVWFGGSFVFTAGNAFWDHICRVRVSQA